MVLFCFSNYKNISYFQRILFYLLKFEIENLNRHKSCRSRILPFHSNRHISAKISNQLNHSHQPPRTHSTKIQRQLDIPTATRKRQPSYVQEA